jgi:hypothetical protein
MFPQTPASTQAPSSSPEAITTTPPPETNAPGDDAGFSRDIQQLIHETEEAFKLRQSLIDAKLPDHELAKFPKPKAPSPMSPPMRRKSQRRSQGSVKSVKSPTKASMKAPLLPTQARLPSSSRPKRAKSKKSRRRPRVAARQSSMWQLTESAKDLFNIRIFHRIEADEMLPESTLREIRGSRAAHWTRSPELGVTHVDNKSAAAAAPIEPLSLDGSRDGAAEEDAVTPRASVVNQGREINREDCKTPMPQQPPQAPPTNGANKQESNGQLSVLECTAEEVDHEPSLPLQQPDSPTTRSFDGDDEDGSLPIMTMAEDEPPATAKLAGSPMPPPAPTTMKAPLHRRLPSRQLPPLPTIPEIIATGPEEATLSPTSVPQPPGSACRVNKDDYIFLDSNPWTLTMPAFRHGQIRLAKADLPIGKLAAAVDDTLDWTAFQMAILGGAGDFFSEPTDYSRPSEAELDELEELASWFASFGFQGPGALVGPSEPRTPPQPWTPVMPRTPAGPTPCTSSPSPMSMSTTGPGSPGIMRRIDPPAASHADINGGSGMVPFTDSIAGRFFPPAALSSSLASPPPPPPATSTHRHSDSSTTFDQPQPSPNQASQAPAPASELPPPSWSYTTTSSSWSQTPPPGALTFSTRNRAGLAIDAGAGGRRPSVDSVQSLPQSPMMDLVVSRDVEGNEYMVPMGFNLSHDLGDFLTWHAAHVVPGAAAGFAFGGGAGAGEGGGAGS